MVEYALILALVALIVIVALIAVAAIAVYQFFGSSIRHQTSAIAKEVSGQSADGERNLAKAAADDAATESNQKKGLDNFSNNASRK